MILIDLGSGQLRPHRSGEQYKEYAENKGRNPGDPRGRAGRRNSLGRALSGVLAMGLGHGPLLITRSYSLKMRNRTRHRMDKSSTWGRYGRFDLKIRPSHDPKLHFLFLWTAIREKTSRCAQDFQHL